MVMTSGQGKLSWEGADPGVTFKDGSVCEESDWKEMVNFLTLFEMAMSCSPGSWGLGLALSSQVGQLARCNCSEA